MAEGSFGRDMKLKPAFERYLQMSVSIDSASRFRRQCHLRAIAASWKIGPEQRMDLLNLYATQSLNYILLTLFHGSLDIRADILGLRYNLPLAFPER
jgi:hypothetical protein